MESEADAGDAAAGDLAGGEGLAVFVGEVEDREAEAMACPSQPVRLGGLFQPVDESFHLSVDDFLCASETDADNYEGLCREALHHQARACGLKASVIDEVALQGKEMPLISRFDSPAVSRLSRGSIVRQRRNVAVSAVFSNY